MPAEMILLFFVAVFLASCIIFKVPLAFSMGLTAAAMVIAFGLSKTSLAQVAFSSVDSFPFLAVPFFIFAGALMEHSGISRSLIDLVQSVVGKIRGSLGAVMVLASAAFGVLTGSTMATLTSIGNMMIPEMVRRGYKKSYAAALAASSSFLGILIPPSVPGIFYAMSAGVSISKVWLSTLVPGFLFMAFYCVLNYFIHGRKEVKSKEKVTFVEYVKNIGFQTKNAFAALLMPIIMFGGIYGGIFTPTEAGAVCSLYGVIYFIIKKYYQKKKIEQSMWKIVVSSAGMTSVVCVAAAFSGAAGRTLGISGVSSALADMITSSVKTPTGFLLICNIIFIFLGMLIDINASIIIMTPLLLPAVLKYNIDPIHFGSIMLVNLSIGYLTPPMAGSVFFICKLADESFVDVTKESLPFISAGLIILLIVTYVPTFSTWLPYLT